MTNRIHWAWVITIAAFITTFTYFSIRMTYTILMPEMIPALKITKAQAGAIASSFFVSYTALVPFIGFLMDRLNARRLLPTFSVIHGIGTFLMGTAASFLQASLFFSMVGAASSAMYVPVMTLIQRWFGPRHRGMALGILSTSWTLGYALMGLILPPLVAWSDWRTCWWILSGLAFALVPMNFLLLRNKPEDLGLRPWGEEVSAPPDDPSSGPRRLGYGEILKLPHLWRLSFSYFLMSFTSYIIATFIVTYAQMELGFAYGPSARLASTIAFSGMAGGILLPILSDRLGRRRCILLNNLLLAASIIPITLSGSHGGFLLVTVGIFGFFFAACWPMYAAAAGEFFPAGTTGAVLGIWGLFYGLGVILGPTMGGIIADLTGSFRYSFYVAAATGVLGAVFFACGKSEDGNRASQ